MMMFITSCSTRPVMIVKNNCCKKKFISKKVLNAMCPKVNGKRVCKPEAREIVKEHICIEKINNPEYNKFIK